MQMTKRVSSLVLAIVMLLEILVPQTTMAKKEVKAPSDNLVKVGLINGNSYDSKLMLELNRLTAKSRKKRSADSGTRLFGYFEDGQEPKDGDKLKYHGEVKADLTVKGLDGNAFQWNEVFGKEEVHLRFIQINDESGDETGTERVLNISRADTYTWTDGDGNPAELPLFNNKLEPLTYEVKLDEEVSDRVKLLTARLTKTDNASPTFDLPDNEGRIKYHLTLEIGLQQVASSKFVSEWNTAVEENARPQLEGTMTGSMVTGGSKPKTINFNLPKNNSDEVIVKTNSRRDQNKFLPEFLFKTPKVKLVETNENGLTFDTTKKTVTSGDHKFKYNFSYDVINGGKLTMTEVIPVTFDANGGKFASITDATAKQEIVKEVEYNATLTDKAENPTKDRETFKGWSETKGGTTPVKDDAFKNITKAKTFYAIWDNNDIVANELEVKESFKDSTGYVNDFIPKLADLKKQVKIKDGSGNPQPLANGDTLAIVDGTNEYTADDDALKDYLYGKLQEKDNPKDEPTRVETVKAKVSHANGTSQTVDMPIKVIKNIYQAKTLTKKPFYVPDNYKKVTLDPTTKATDPQKTYYYVNPDAKVVIPGTDPTGTGDNKFIKWTMKADNPAAGDKEEDYKLTERHQFAKDSTITAHYSADVVPQEGNTKPDGVPEGFVKVTFVPTDNGTMEGAKIFWVNPKVAVTIPVKDPVGKTYFTFKEWKIGDVETGDTYTVGAPKQFTAQETTITATYTQGEKIIPFNPEDANPMARPEGYVKVTFKAETGLKFKESKGYYVKKDAGITLKTIQEDDTKGYPTYEVVKGYKFDKWDPADTTVIADKDLVVTAKATPLSDVMEKKDGEAKPEGYVEVTFVPTDKATDKATKTFWVNPEKAVTIPITDPKGATYYTFKEWKLGANADGAVYKPTVAQKFTAEKTTITATYDKAEDIIAYDPNDPKTKPEGYVRVTFEAEEGLTLSGVKAYYVKKDANITLGNAKIAKPTTAAKTGYTFKEWDKKDDLVLGTEDVVVKAMATTLPDKKEKKQGEQKPTGYLEVKFVAGENGKLTENNANIAEKVYYVNPNKYVTLTPPTAVGNTGYEFGSWSQNAEIPTQYTKPVTEITASFNQLKDVIPKTKKNDSEKPAGYKTVTFVIPNENEGYIYPGQTNVYYVDPTREVTLTPPLTKVHPGYKFKEWDQDTTKPKKYDKDTTVKASFTKLDDIIPSIDGKGNSVPKPDEYVTVVFEKGEHGSLKGVTTYYVNPAAKKTIGDVKQKALDKKALGQNILTVTPDTGYEFKSWLQDDDKVITDASNVYRITAQYKPLPDVIPKTKTDESEKPKGYVEVKFVAGKNGKLIDSEKEIAEKVYYVNPEKYVKLTAPKDLAKGNTGYVFSTWDRDISNYNKFTDKVTKITANFVAKDAVVPKKKDDDSEKPAGFVTVKFEVDPQSTGQGSLEGTTTYFVDPSQDVTLSPPKTNPSIGYEFEKWSQDTTQAKKYEKDTIVKVTFKKLDDVISGDQAQPKGYLTVTFVADSNGSLSGTTKYYVKPKTSVDLSNQADAITKTPNLGYTEKGGSWSNDNSKKLNDTFSADASFKYNFKELPSVDTTNHPGYVKVEFIAGENGQIDGGNKTYYVNPEKNITVGSTELPIPDTKPSENYKFDNWYEAIDKTEPIKNDKKFVARFKLNKVTMTYKADDATTGIVPAALSYEIGTEITLAGGNDLKKDNYVLKGWEIGGTTYTPGAKYKIEGDTTANAVWATDYHTVNFDTQDGGYIPSQKVKHNESIGSVTNPVKENHTFTGWKVDGKDFDPATAKVEKDITLVAQYVSDVVPAKDDGNKPEGTPDNFVKVTFVPTDKAKDTTQKIFYVNPAKEVTIPVPDPVGTVGKNKEGKIVQWQFTGWNKPLKGKFTGETTITALYEEVPQVPGSVGYLVTEEGVQPTLDQYKGRIQPPEGRTIATVEFVEKPDVSKPGVSTAKLKVTYDNGTSSDVTMTVFVQRKPQGDWQTGTLGSTRILTVVEKEVVKVPAEKTFRKEVRYMQGFNNYFRPTEGLTRAEAAQILANALVEDGYRYDPNFAIHYKDIEGNEWYAKAIRITSQANVFKGYDTGYFAPHKKITRAEWIGTLRRFQELERAPGNHMQVRPDHWAMGEIEAAYKEGWLAIYGQGLARFNADEFIPRQEVAAVSNKAFNRVLDKTYIHRNSKNLINYKDVNPSMWSYEDILCASNGYLHDGKSFWGHKIDYKKDLYNINLDGYTVTKDKFQRLERR